MLVVLGFIVVFASMALMALRGGGRARGGGVIMLGPIPIVFGSDVGALKMAIILAIALTVAALIMSLAPMLTLLR
ncbi:hypothetical protein B6U99_05220 [Candidatus Geothermarchaeota archaeon ex4572_27]|nr:MAG: hypothetical protein B6U99_05220 [Candidatus Geothermarchaeota archaeon ex4572_27]